MSLPSAGKGPAPGWRRHRFRAHRNDRRRQGIEHPRRGAGGGSGVRRAFEEEDEFVAGQAGQGVLAAADAAQAARHVDEDGIARAMAQAVVDQLETVEVDEAQGKAPARLAAREKPRAGGGRSARGWQPGQRVVVGEVGELGSGRLAGRDVVDDPDVAGEGAGFAMHRGEEEFEPLLRTVGPLPASVVAVPRRRWRCG